MIKKCYVIETDHSFVEYQKVLLICETKELAEMYLPIIKNKCKVECKVDIPIRITERTFMMGDDMIKAQTIQDYHNHVIRLINRKINELNCSPILFVEEGTLEKYYEIQYAISVLKDLKEDMVDDWTNSNYSKVNGNE